MLREFKQLAEGCITSNILQTLCLQHLPSRDQETFAVVESVSLNKLTELVDKVSDRNNNITIASTEMQSNQQSQVLADLVKKIEALIIRHRKN